MNRHSANSLSPLRRPVLVCVLLVLVTVAVYFPVIHYGFVGYDDNDYFYANPHVLAGLTWADFRWAFSSQSAVNWHPLTWLSLMFDAQFFGKGAAAPHLTNVLLHAANAVLVFVLFRRCTGAYWRSAAVAFLFAVHPLHVESVAWISERKDVLSGFFFLLTLLCYARYALPPQRERVASSLPVLPSSFFYCLALFFFACGLMSKPMLVTLPFVLWLLDVWPFQRISASNLWPLIVEKIPFLLLSAATCVVTFFVQRNGGAVPPLSRFPLDLRVENIFASYAAYLGKIFWPVHLATPYPAPRFEPMAYFVFSVMLFAGLSFAALALKRRFPFAFTGWFWFAGMLVPVIGIVQVGAQAMADRYVYLPIIGVLLIVVWGAAEICSRRQARYTVVGTVAVFLFIVLGLRAASQVSFWKDDATLFGHAAAVTKDNYFADLHLAHWYEKHGNMQDALDYYYAAALVSPGDAADLYNAANAFAKYRRWSEAIVIYRRALKTATNPADILNNLGYALAQNHEFPEAVDCFQKVLALDPNSSGAHNNLGALFFAQGNDSEAARQYEAALRLSPNDPRLMANLGDALARLKETNNAAVCYEHALKLEPGNAQIMAKLRALGPQR